MACSPTGSSWDRDWPPICGAIPDAAGRYPVTDHRGPRDVGNRAPATPATTVGKPVVITDLATKP